MISAVKIEEDTLKFRMVDETLTGTVETAGDTSLTGTATAFTTELKVGDYVTVGTELRQIATITNDTTATVSVAFTPTASGLTATANSMFRKPVFLGTTDDTNKFGKLELRNFTTLKPVTGDGTYQLVGWMQLSIILIIKL